MSLIYVCCFSNLTLTNDKKPERVQLRNGQYQYYTISIKDHKPYSILSTSQIIQHSSNIGIIKIIEKVGPKILYNVSRDFGFGSKTGIKLDGVKGT